MIEALFTVGGHSVCEVVATRTQIDHIIFNVLGMIPIYVIECNEEC